MVAPTQNVIIEFQIPDALLGDSSTPGEAMPGAAVPGGIIRKIHINITEVT